MRLNQKNPTIGFVLDLSHQGTFSGRVLNTFNVVGLQQITIPGDHLIHVTCREKQDRQENKSYFCNRWKGRLVISKNRIKFVQSLHRKKYRQRYRQFTVEGEKSVLELLHSSIKVVTIFTTAQWANDHVSGGAYDVVICEQDDLKPISFFATPSPVVAVAEMPELALNLPEKGAWYLALDGINDPGNLGTLIRIADWYGISSIYCSEDTVDTFNPKTISSSMGSFTRVNVYHGNLPEYLSTNGLPIYLTEMSGTPIDTLSNLEPGAIVIGSEAHGVREELRELPVTSISIRRIGGAESLNASVAAGIICDRLIQHTTP